MLGVKSDENSQVTRSSLKGLYITPKSLDFILEDSGEPLKYCLAEKCLSEWPFSNITEATICGKN